MPKFDSLLNYIKFYLSYVYLSMSYPQIDGKQLWFVFDWKA